VTVAGLDVRPQASELRARRARIADAIGSDGVALIPAAPTPRSSIRFRQTNEFYYATALEVPGAHVLIEGRDGSTTLYLPHRDERRERVDGPGLWAEDVDRVRELTGADSVRPTADLPAELAGRLFRGRLVLHTPFAPA
jgi:Xaa-Pro aminopeptidase